MKPRVVVVDTNVLIAGLLTGDDESPTARVLRQMLEGRFVFMISTALLSEYRQVLLRPKVANLHGLSANEIDTVLIEIVGNAVVREPDQTGEGAPEPGDQHLWDLLACERGAVLITGDRALLEQPPREASVVSPAAFVATPLILTPKSGPVGVVHA